MTRDELESAVSSLMDNTISPDVFAALQEYLRTSEEGRRSYAGLVCLHSLLQEEHGHLPVAGGRPLIQMDRVLARQKRRTLRFALTASGIAAAAAIVVSTLVTLPASPAARVKGSSLAAFTITHPTSGETPSHAGDVLAIGSRLRLDRGTVELQFKSGVNGIVRAPADLMLHRENLISLGEGTAWFHVPEGAVGFQVETPDLLVTDLGTEFGVISCRDAADEVHVFDGQVEVENRRTPSSPTRVVRGEARVTKPDGIEEVELDPEGFFTSLPSESALPPFLYWSFDGDDPAAVGGRHPDRDKVRVAPPEEGERVQVPGRVGQGMRVGRISDRIATSWRGVDGNRPRTVAFWIKIPPSQNAAGNGKTLVYWGGKKRDPWPEDSWAVRVSGPHPEQGVDLEFSTGGGEYLKGTTRLNDGEWHHVAVVYNGTSDPDGHPVVKFFVDGIGERLASHTRLPPIDTLDTNSDPNNANPLWIATARSRELGAFDGAMDELYIFDGRVIDSVIYELANPSPLSSQAGPP